MSDEGNKVSAVQVYVTTFPRVYFTSEIAEQIQEIISMCIFTRMHRYNFTPPKFNNNPSLVNGVLTIECRDKESLQVLIEYFNMKQDAYYNRFRCQEFPELNIKFHTAHEIPELVKCSILIPNCSDMVCVAHQKLSAQNKEYDIDNWYYINHEKLETPNGLILKYYIPKEILDEIKDFKLSFGFGCVILNVDSD